MIAATAPEDRIVWLASYPRSGNALIRFQLGAYACGKATEWSVCNSASLDLHGLLGVARRENFDVAELPGRIRQKLDSWPQSEYRTRAACIKTHFKRTPDHLWIERTHKIIYLLRHPKDVLLSAINYLKLMDLNAGSDREAAWNFLRHGGMPMWQAEFGSWFEHYESWTKDVGCPVLLLRYEDFKQDPLAQLVRMIRFLELPLDTERAKRAVADTSFDRVKKLEQEHRAQKDLPQFKKGFDLVWKGKSGQSLEQIEPGLDRAFDEAFAEQLAAAGYPAVNVSPPPKTAAEQSGM